MTPSRYLAGIAEARGLYLWLYEDALRMLPPPSRDVAHDITSHATLKDAAKALGWPYSAVRRCLVQLVMWGWVRDRKMPRYLGRRDGATLHLLGDLAAEERTGEVGVVSRIVLGHSDSTQLYPPGTPTNRVADDLDGRGTNRKWEGMDDAWQKLKRGQRR